jgi:hypothetical protein
MLATCFQFSRDGLPAILGLELELEVYDVYVRLMVLFIDLVLTWN